MKQHKCISSKDQFDKNWECEQKMRVEEYILPRERIYLMVTRKRAEISIRPIPGRGKQLKALGNRGDSCVLRYIDTEGMYATYAAYIVTVA